MFHEELGLHCLEVAYFANCPWVRLHLETCQSSAYRSDLTMSSAQNWSISAVTGSEDDEMARHRRQGHIPFNPNCLECAKRTFSVSAQTRKRCRFRPDFAFLSTKGEVVADKLPGSVKILVLVEMMSRCIWVCSRWGRR